MTGVHLRAILLAAATPSLRRRRMEIGTLLAAEALVLGDCLSAVSATVRLAEGSAALICATAACITFSARAKGKKARTQSGQPGREKE